MEKTSFKVQQISSSSFMIFSLFLSGFATHAPLLISGLFLIDISETFGYPVGVIGQITTARSAVAMIFAIMIGGISMQYKSKSLLLTGLLIYCASAVCCFIAPNFQAMLLSYSLTGVATAMVIPMLGTIVGETLPTRERSTALGVIMAGQPISFVIGSPIVNYIAHNSGWRTTFIGYMLPLIIICFVVAYFSIPNIQRNKKIDQKGVLKGFKELFLNRSALACLIGAALVQASLMTAFVYFISFFREKFLITTVFATALISGTAVSSALGNLVAGKIISILDNKKTVSIFALMLGILNILTFISRSLWVSSVTVLFLFLSGWCAYTSGDSLSLEQVPEYRGAMMSISSAVRSMGTTFGAMIGGIILLSFDYGILGIVTGVFGVVAALNYHLFTSNPA